MLNQNLNLELLGGTYQLQVSDSNGCSLVKSLTIDFINDFNVNAVKDTLINLSTSHKINENASIPWSSLREITWSPSNTLSCSNCPDPIANPENDTENFITIIDQNGCIRSDAIWVRVKFDKGYTAHNIIDPKSTLGNNKFTIYPIFASIESIKTLTIYDRWDNKLFNVKDIPAGNPDYSWNGTFDGKEIHPGVFVWVAEIIYKDNTSEVDKGDITIIK